MIKRFVDILDGLRHLSEDQKKIFYRFICEDGEDISLLSIEEKQGLLKFCRMCCQFVPVLPSSETKSDKHYSDRFWGLFTKLVKELYPDITISETDDALIFTSKHSFD